MTNSNVVELFQKSPAVANDEEYIALYKQNDGYIYYVRNYVAHREFKYFNQIPLNVQKRPHYLRSEL
ncbi:hypothetical protein GCM10008027_44400 [Pseudoalteromonas gelatinilytica]|uniref:Uncharacterized protein n=1 Tax=Pseudoalteromonas gelatinilytica TaxID=1703256 RepID=A0ABQ1UCI4_9GAMM|nr:hypothetical protein GCM10008027_44400 [Pseudoalteromonas profundi]